MMTSPVNWWQQIYIEEETPVLVFSIDNLAMRPISLVATCVSLEEVYIVILRFMS